MTLTAEAAPLARPRLLRIQDACSALNLGETKLRELANDGLLDLVKIGTASRITAESVDRFIATAPRKGGRRAA